MSDTDLVPDASRISPPRLAEGLNPDVKLTINVELTPELASTRDGRSLRISDLAALNTSFKLAPRTVSFESPLPKQTICLTGTSFCAGVLSVSRCIVRGALSQGGKEEKQEGYAMLSLVPPPRVEWLQPLVMWFSFWIDLVRCTEPRWPRGHVRFYCLRSVLTIDSRLTRLTITVIGIWIVRLSISLRRQVLRGRLSHSGEGRGLPNAVTARGGTELGKALIESIDLIKASKKRGRVPVIVVLTDGQIGNESQLFSIVQRTAGDTRIFTVGIDNAANCPFLSRLAALGSGTATFVAPGAQLEDALVQVGREIGAPLITDLNRKPHRWCHY